MMGMGEEGGGQAKEEGTTMTASDRWASSCSSFLMLLVFLRVVLVVVS